MKEIIYDTNKWKNTFREIQNVVIPALWEAEAGGS